MPTARQLKSRFRRTEIARKVLRGLFLSGAIAVAATSPHFITNALKYWRRHGFGRLNAKERKQFSDTFTGLRQRGLLKIRTVNNQIYISLTKEGKKRAGQYQIDELEIARPRKWDRRWRVLIFDIPEKSRIKRDALRGKLKELGFSMLQKSVWVHPYPCHGELALLQEFFGFEEKDYILIEASEVGKKGSRLVKHYKLR